MKTVKTMEALQGWVTPCSLALGAFDGLHRGHQAVLTAAAAPPFAGAWGVVTFEASPAGGPALLTGPDKEALISQAGAALLCSFRFGDVRDLEARQFVREVLFQRCRAARLVCGEDFRFGRGALGDAALLESLCREQGAELLVVPPVRDGGEKISSTRIRRAVEAGDIPMANRLLGRLFGYRLEVVHGNHLGTGLGAPTLNQVLPQGFALPRFGVYASVVEAAGKQLAGVTNIGVKPTVGAERPLSETWIPGFSGDLYGKKVQVSLVEFIRPEKKFGSLEALQGEIRKNGEQAVEIVKKTLQTGKTVVE